MPIINITIRDKKPSDPVEQIVCGNSDYKINFDFDSEWDEYEVKTARFSFNNQHIDVVFSGNVCDVPVLSNITICGVGVFAGDIRTTTKALIKCRKSILCDGGVPTEPTPDVYAQIMELLNNSGGGGGSAEGAVLYVPQTLDEEQQKQARDNIDAAAKRLVVEVRLKSETDDNGDIDEWIEVSHSSQEVIAHVQEGGTAGLLLEVGLGSVAAEALWIYDNSVFFLAPFGEMLVLAKLSGKEFSTEYIDLEGPQGPPGEPGPAGPAGADGYTPIKGVDYWTQEDKREIVNEVLAELPAAEGVGF